MSARRRARDDSGPDGSGSDLVLLQTTIPAYRDAFVEQLLDQLPNTVICAGDEYFDPTIRLSPFAARASQRLRNRYLLGRRLEWQHGAFSAARNARVVVLELNPRILSNWLILIHRRLLHRRTVLWGHAWPRRGPRARTFLIRIPFLRLADAVLVYTYRDRDQLAERIRTPVSVAPNAVASRTEWSETGTGTPINAVQVGRLIPGKRPALALSAWLNACDKVDASARFIFVGDGPMRPRLEAMAAAHRHGARVEFLGEVTDRSALNAVYADALVSVCAGYAGLSLTDSFGCGVPMLIADHEPHSPEIALASPLNSRFFRARDMTALAEGIERFFNDRQFWVSKRVAVAEETRKLYSIEAMVEGFLGAVRGA